VLIINNANYSAGEHASSRTHLAGPVNLTLQLDACRNAAAAATALEKLLSGVLTDAGLAEHSSGSSSSSSSSSHPQTRQRLPASLQELQACVTAACSRAGRTAKSLQQTSAELSSSLLEHYKQQQQNQQWAALPSMQVPSADALVAALNTAVYSQVRWAAAVSVAYNLMPLATVETEAVSAFQTLVRCALLLSRTCVGFVAGDARQCSCTAAALQAVQSAAGQLGAAAQWTGGMCATSKQGIQLATFSESSYMWVCCHVTYSSNPTACSCRTASPF
jgi:hypothetical protein